MYGMLREVKAIAEDVRDAADVLRGAAKRISNEWPAYDDHPQELKDVETTVQTCLVELERATSVEIPALLKLLAERPTLTR